MKKLKRNYWASTIALVIMLLLPGVGIAQSNIEVKGIVTSAATGEPLVGVSVVQKGATNATITDIDGRYAITVRPGATLVFSYVGYETQELLAS
ncbi:MAG: carboxypeptidase-like regulatory domain-containing protein, partial [Prevotellaceae bacterium]|nr:carboxypeptidase-like regulatory domain-containing protein [Prevotellaceae bacterium]